MPDRPYAVPLLATADPAQVVAGLDAADQASVFWGRWFDGGLAVLVRPVRTEQPLDAADGFGWLDEPSDPSSDFTGLGGGWVTVLGYAPGHTAYAFYSAVLRWTAERGWWFESLGRPEHAVGDAALLAHWRDRLTTPLPPSAAYHLGGFSTREPAGATRDAYLAGVEQAIGQIDRGRCYQLNLCTRLHAEFAGRPAALFARLVTALQPDYAALVDVGPRTLVSCSPELFLRLRGQLVETAPIKGTAPRTAADDRGAEVLRGSAKDAAENIMIVDLMRNDLSRVCQPGTVAVGPLLDVQPHPGVWHLVSTVRGRLRDEVGVADLLRATFPPGSVTGAPKSAAQVGIAELEPESRGAYTGSIGLTSPYAGAELSVSIRTLEIDDGHAELGVGGGITVDSVPIREWAECLDKAAALVGASGSQLDPALRPATSAVDPQLSAYGLLESMLADGPRVLRLAGHLDRLDRSCRELYGSAVPDDLARRVAAAVADRPSGSRTVVRLHARPTVTGLHVAVTTAFPEPDPTRVFEPRQSTLAQVERPAGCWRHKWADRRTFRFAESMANQRAPGSLPYFVDGPGSTVTESSRGNIFSRRADGAWVTPPADDQLLPGVTRRAVIDLLADRGLPVAIERLTVADLRGATGAFWTSSLSGAVAISAVDGHPLPSALALLAELNHALGLGPSC